MITTMCLISEGQPETIVADIENMVRSYVEKVYILLFKPFIFMQIKEKVCQALRWKILILILAKDACHRFVLWLYFILMICLCLYLLYFLMLWLVLRNSKTFDWARATPLALYSFKFSRKSSQYSIADGEFCSQIQLFLLFLLRIKILQLQMPSN